MIDIEKLQNDYLDCLCKEYLYWFNKYRYHNDEFSLEMVNYTIYRVDNFDSTYIDMVEQETRFFLSLILSKIRNYEDPFEEVEEYTMLKFNKNDTLVLGFVNHAKFVRGYVNEGTVSKFISDVKKSLISTDVKSVYLERRIDKFRSGINQAVHKVNKKEA